MAWRYRLWQLAQELRSRPLSRDQWAAIGDILTPEEQALFRRFRPGDQHHSWRVFHLLRSAGHQERPLLAAALLHDIGKTRVPLSLADRVLIVLSGRLGPSRLARWGQGTPAGWRRPFAVKQQHPLWGAAMAVAAGSDPETVSLIRRHQSPVTPEEHTVEATRLRLLQWADDQS